MIPVRVLISICLLTISFKAHASMWWGLENVEAPRAWRLTTPSEKPIVVAVIDTGADLTHPALASHLWTNPGETGLDASGKNRATNGIDDDGNGLIDDVNGWNFAANRSDIRDLHGHGTHIAGIIAGVAPAAKLMILKYYDPQAKDDNAIPNTVRAIDYAVANGAQVINYSAGGARPNAAERGAIERARAKGVLIVAAAGNEASNSDLRRYYPADYGVSNILSVTAINPLGQILPSSNWGLLTVHLAAPGEGIFSALPGGKYGRMTGTSQATAFASGTAALVIASMGASSGVALRPEKVIEHLVNTGVRSENLQGRTRARTVINAYQALAIRGDSGGADRVSNTAAIDPLLFSSHP